MKKMLVLALLSSSMMFAEPTPAVTAVVEAAKTVVAAPKTAGLVTRAWAQIVRPFIYAGTKVSSAASYTATKVANGATSAKNAAVSAAKTVATTVKTNTVAAAQGMKKHYVITTGVVAVAGIATLYYTNAAFRAKVRELLGLDKTEAQNA